MALLCQVAFTGGRRRFSNPFQHSFFSAERPAVGNERMGHQEVIVGFRAFRWLHTGFETGSTSFGHPSQTACRVSIAKSPESRHS